MAAPYRTVLHEPAAAIAEGDSLALHLKKYNHLDGNPVLGRSPSEVLEAIKANLAINPDYYKNRDVILSGGVTNVPGEIELVRDQIDLLKKNGATVALIGVGPGVENSVTLNQRLATIAGDKQIDFVAAPAKEFNWDKERKHIGPEANRTLFGQIETKFAAIHAPAAKAGVAVQTSLATPSAAIGSFSP